MGGPLTVWAPEGIGEVGAGEDLVRLIAGVLGDQLQDGDVLAVTSKIVSKAESRQVVGADREEAITAETVRVVATRAHAHGAGVTRIVENRQGFVMAAAGVDASNTAEGIVLLLPRDPDASAQRLCDGLRRRLGVRIGVVLTDTFGRPWREGQTDVAIGAAGIAVLADLRGTADASGKQLSVTAPAIADEIAAAADLVKGKTQGRPVAVVRGLGHYVIDGQQPVAEHLVRDADDDLFSLGTAEARAEGFEQGFEAARIGTMSRGV